MLLASVRRAKVSIGRWIGIALMAAGCGSTSSGQHAANGGTAGQAGSMSGGATSSTGGGPSTGGVANTAGSAGAANTGGGNAGTGGANSGGVGGASAGGANTGGTNTGGTNTGGTNTGGTGGTNTGGTSTGGTSTGGTNTGGASTGGTGGTTVYTITGQVYGPSSGLTLTDGLGHTVSPTTNGYPAFVFPASPSGSTYDVQITKQPTNWFCIVANATGTLTQDVTDVAITCKQYFGVYATVNNLTSNGLVVTLTDTTDGVATDVPLSDGSGQLLGPILDTHDYTVVVKTPPSQPIQNCVITNGSGTIRGIPVTDVTLDCTVSNWTLGGTVVGLTGTNLQVELTTSAGVQLAVVGTSTFTFPSAIPNYSAYTVKVVQDPSIGTLATKWCVVTSGASGVMPNANFTAASTPMSDLVVTCSDLLASCKALHAQHPELPSDAYTIKPLGPSVVPTRTLCDMDYNDGLGAGGWTLILWTGPTFIGPEAEVASTTFSPISVRAGSYMDPNTMANGLVKQGGDATLAATQIHIRTTGNTSRSITSVPNTLPITNLGNMRLLNANFPSGDMTADRRTGIWTGPLALLGILNFQNTGAVCADSISGVDHLRYPGVLSPGASHGIYWTCGNNNPGLTLASTGSIWGGGGAEDMQVWVR